MAKKKFTLNNGKISFGSDESRHAYILNGILKNLLYIGKESKLSKTEEALKKLSVKQIKRVIKFLDKDFLKVKQNFNN